MLIFTAGQSPVYGRQILYFLDPVFSVRARILPPTKSDSLYEAPVQEKPQEPNAPVITEADYEKYLCD
jgi:type IV secretion system protein VirD4